MQIVLVKKNNIQKYPFPNDYVKSYWIKDTDEFNDERNLISIEKEVNNWELVSNNKCKIFENNTEVNKIVLSLNKIYQLKINDNGNNEDALLYVYNKRDINYQIFKIADGEYTIGSSNNSNIMIQNKGINSEHAILIKRNNKFEIKATNNYFGTYVNNIRDTLFIMGYYITIINSNIIIWSHLKNLTINSENIIKAEFDNYNGNYENPVDDIEAELYDEFDYFQRAPRFVTSITEEDISIDSPPGKIEPDETPILYTIGPMLTMAMSSVVTA